MDLNEAYTLGQEDMRQRAAEVVKKLSNHDPKIDAFLKDIGLTISKHIENTLLKDIGG